MRQRDRDRERWEVLQQQLKSSVVAQFCGGYLPQPDQLGKKKREQSKKETREAASQCERERERERERDCEYLPPCQAQKGTYVAVSSEARKRTNRDRQEGR